MDLSTFLILMTIGLLAGIVSGFIGVGGGVVVVPMLIFFLGLTQHQAQGTSLALMLPPIGILACYNYYKTGNLNVAYAIVSRYFLWPAVILDPSFHCDFHPKLLSFRSDYCFYMRPSE